MQRVAVEKKEDYTCCSHTNAWIRSNFNFFKRENLKIYNDICFEGKCIDDPICLPCIAGPYLTVAMLLNGCICVVGVTGTLFTVSADSCLWVKAVSDGSFLWDKADCCAINVDLGPGPELQMMPDREQEKKVANQQQAVVIDQLPGEMNLINSRLFQPLSRINESNSHQNESKKESGVMDQPPGGPSLSLV